MCTPQTRPSPLEAFVILSLLVPAPASLLPLPFTSLLAGPPSALAYRCIPSQTYPFHHFIFLFSCVRKQEPHRTLRLSKSPPPSLSLPVHTHTHIHTHSTHPTQKPALFHASAQTSSFPLRREYCCKHALSVLHQWPCIVSHHYESHLFREASPIASMKGHCHLAPRSPRRVAAMFDNALSSPSRLPFLKGMMQQNVITCVYEMKLAGLCRHVTVTWLRNAKGHGLSVTVDDPSCQYTCKVKMNPWSFWKKQGVKSFEVCGSKVEVYWDLSSARYICGPEPQWGFYVAVVCNREVVLLLGDKSSEAYKKTRARPSIIDATLVSRKEHIFGKKFFCTKAPFDESGKVHDIIIECETSAPKEPYLCIKVDTHLLVHVRNLEWKFRGNQTVIVDGVTMQVFWDVHNWLFSNGGSNAVFIFQACSSGGGGGSHKMMSSKVDGISATVKWSGDLNGSISVMKLTNARSLRSAHDLLGFTGSSLVLNAWKSE